MNISETKLRDFAREVLQKAGADDVSVYHTVEGLVGASLRGIDSHGIRLLPHYVDAIEAGRLTKTPNIAIDRTSLGTAVVDADHGLGFPAGAKAIAEGVLMAKEAGLAALTVKNSSHGGMLAYYSMLGAKEGCFTVAMSNTTPRLIPPASKSAFLGTNPISYAFPTGDGETLCFDAATTMITGNKIKLHRTLDKPLPEGVAATVEGEPTTNPHEAEYLMPFGGYKGFGIALLVDILCGALTGMPNSSSVSKMYGEDISKPRELGQFFLLVDIGRFRDIKVFCEEVTDELARLRASGAGDAVLAPGDKEISLEKERLTHGIPMEEEVKQLLNAAALKVGCEQFL